MNALILMRKNREEGRNIANGIDIFIDNFQTHKQVIK